MVALPWSDAPVTSSTHVRARHITELRRTVDRNRRVANLAPATWTDNPVSAVTHIRATHFTELRSAIPPSVPIGTWSVGSAPSSSRHISARDLNDLRGWLDAWSQQLGFAPGPDPVPQGVTSLSFDPTANPSGHPPGAIITSDWVQNLNQLGTAATGPLMVRTIVRSSPVDNSINDQAYQQAFGLYGPSSRAVIPVLTGEFDRTGSGPGFALGLPNDPVGVGEYVGQPFLNAYIDDFATKAADFARQMLGSGIREYFIWNEPNNPSVNGRPNADYMDPPQFAGLMHTCSQRIKNVDPTIQVYMGGILWPYSTGPGGTGATAATGLVSQYLATTYSYLQHNGGGVPWDAVNVHPHLCGFTDGDMGYLYSQVRSVFNSGDTRLIYVGEWGVTHDEAAPGLQCMQGAFDAIAHYFDKMWYYAHYNDPVGSCSTGGTAFGLVDYGFEPPSPPGASPYQWFFVNGICVEWNQLHAILFNSGQ